MAMIYYLRCEVTSGWKEISLEDYEYMLLLHEKPLDLFHEWWDDNFMVAAVEIP